MGTLLLMRLLESAPSRYDVGMQVITFGAAGRARRWLAEFVPSGSRLFEIGCGTGTFTALAAGRARFVKAIDTNPAMLAIARERLATLKGVLFEEMGVAELDREPAGQYHAVAAVFSFSELPDGELRWAMDQARRLLSEGGWLLVADERVPEGIGGVLVRVVRLPASLLAWLLFGRVSTPLLRFERRLEEHGFDLIARKTFFFGTIGAWVAQKR